MSLNLTELGIPSMAGLSMFVMNSVSSNSLSLYDVMVKYQPSKEMVVPDKLSPG